MKSIFSLLILVSMLCVSGMSFGSATPNDDKIEKVFVEKSVISDIATPVAVDVIDIDFSTEILKVAPVDYGIFALESENTDLSFSFDLKPVSRANKENYNYLQNYTFTDEYRRARDGLMWASSK